MKFTFPAPDSASGTAAIFPFPAYGGRDSSSPSDSSFLVIATQSAATFALRGQLGPPERRIRKAEYVFFFFTKPLTKVLLFRQ